MHYSFEELAPGVFAAIMDPAGTAASNGGFVDLGDRTLVFDSSMTPASALELREAAVEMTGREPAALINSHYHSDHVLGNQVFAGRPIISTAVTRELMDTRLRAAVDHHKVHLRPEYEARQEELVAENDPATREEIEAYLAFNHPLYTAIDQIELCLPTQTFRQALTFHGSIRDAHLLTYGGGHTSSDAFLYVPDAGVIFIGDLIFNGFHPYIADGDPVATITLLDRIEELGASHFVCGHGPVAGRDQLDFMRAYIRQLQRMVGEVKKRGGSVEEAATLPVPEAFAHLVNLAGMYEQSLRFLFRSA